VFVTKRGKTLLFDILKEMAEQGKFSRDKKGKGVGWGIKVGFLNEIALFAKIGAVHKCRATTDLSSARISLTLAGIELDKVETYVKEATATA
jgi:hypothetical protein